MADSNDPVQVWAQDIRRLVIRSKLPPPSALPSLWPATTGLACDWFTYAQFMDHCELHIQRSAARIMARQVDWKKWLESLFPTCPVAVTYQAECVQLRWHTRTDLEQVGRFLRLWLLTNYLRDLHFLPVYPKESADE